MPLSPNRWMITAGLAAAAIGVAGVLDRGGLFFAEQRASQNGVVVTTLSTPSTPCGANGDARSLDVPGRMIDMLLGADPQLVPLGEMDRRSLDLAPEEGVWSLELGHVADASLLGCIGLRSGDRIVAVNGHALGAGHTFYGSVREAESTGLLRLDLLRGETPMVVTVSYPHIDRLLGL